MIKQQLILSMATSSVLMAYDIYYLTCIIRHKQTYALYQYLQLAEIGSAI